VSAVMVVLVVPVRPAVSVVSGVPAGAWPVRMG